MRSKATVVPLAKRMSLQKQSALTVTNILNNQPVMSPELLDFFLPSVGLKHRLQHPEDEDGGSFEGHLTRRCRGSEVNEEVKSKLLLYA